MGVSKWFVAFVALWLPCAICDASSSSAIDNYFKPFVATNNFSGSVLVVKNGETVFEKSYGFADPLKRVRNTADTRFHIASNSMLFTAFAIMRLVEQHKISLDEPVGDIVSDIPNARRITIRELLEEKSGLPDVNDLPTYDNLLTAHQTPESLVAQIHGLKPLAEPGKSGTDEEHSAYNVLALIIERKTGLHFAEAMRQLVFAPAGMRDSGADDDGPMSSTTAVGQNVIGEFGLKIAPAIHWSALPGNGSVYSTTRDINIWFDALLNDKLLSASARTIMLSTNPDTGYGWDDKSFDKRFNQIMYFSGGRVAGFSSTIIYFPNERLRMILLSNIEHDMSFNITEDIASIVLGKPYVAFTDRPVLLSASARAQLTGKYKFGADFYRPNATLAVRDTARGLVLEWPQRVTPLLPVSSDAFFDRFYWLRCTVVQNAKSRPVSLNCGKFEGTFVSPA